MRELTLESKPLLLPRLRSLNIPLSEYSFANLFLFRKKHNYHVVHLEGEIFIRGVTYDGVEVLMPTSVPEPAMMEVMIGKGLIFYPIPEQWLQLFPKGCHHTNHQEDNDYLFQREKIASYAGRDLSPKRNLVSQFVKDYDAEIVSITTTSLPDAFKVLEEWSHHSDNPNDDRSECAEALKYFGELSLSGSLFYVEKTPIAFLIGEELIDNTYIIHFAKALREYKGVYPYIYQQFARELPQNITWLNFEQDLGMPNLRQAKHSFHPDAYGLKFRVSR